MAYFRVDELERLMRDVRAAVYHPLQPKRQHLESGRVALGLDPVTRGVSRLARCASLTA